ncbi:hypothetical protein B484DRAFT_104929 [Ochromonadaceae sp. CCMP2298]|nr:hypothetical protein B484DRAFT_104929 [Ochromonadaceae sp. CCMP2298]
MCIKPFPLYCICVFNPGLMHISDWFPTLLELVGVPYIPYTEGYSLDGVSHAAAITAVNAAKSATHRHLVPRDPQDPQDPQDSQDSQDPQGVGEVGGGGARGAESTSMDSVGMGTGLSTGTGTRILSTGSMSTGTGIGMGISAGTGTHSTMVSGAASPSPRKYMLYNAYANVSGESFDTHTNANAAVRNGRYKLLRAYVDNKSSYW